MQHSHLTACRADFDLRLMEVLGQRVTGECHTWRNRRNGLDGPAPEEEGSHLLPRDRLVRAESSVVRGIAAAGDPGGREGGDLGLEQMTGRVSERDAAWLQVQSARQERSHLTPRYGFVGTEPSVVRWVTAGGYARLGEGGYLGGEDRVLGVREPGLPGFEAENSHQERCHLASRHVPVGTEVGTDLVAATGDSRRHHRPNLTGEGGVVRHIQEGGAVHHPWNRRRRLVLRVRRFLLDTRVQP